MKKKTISLGKKLFLNKETIAALNDNQQMKIKGGATAAADNCVGSSHCDIRFTRQVNCVPFTEDDRCCQLTQYCPAQTDNCA